MAKLHDLPAAAALTGAELIPLDQNDATKKAPAQAFADLALGQAAAVLPVQMAPESGLRWAFIDPAANKLLFALTADHKLLAPAGAITPDLLDPSIGVLPSGVFGAPLAPESAWLAVFGITADGKACGILKDGTFVGYVPAVSSIDQAKLIYTRAASSVPLLPNAGRIVVLGDSTAEGAGASGPTTIWHYLLGTALGLPIVNLGIGGQLLLDQIAGRFDAIPVTITLSGNSIPADTSSVAVDAISVDLLANGSGTSARTMPLSIAGVAGVLTKTGGTTYSWARSVAGVAVAIGANTACKAIDGSTYANDTLILCGGTNDRGFASPYPSMQSALAIVRRTSPYFKRVLVASPRGLTGTDTSGTVKAGRIQAMERIGRQMFGGNYLDLRRFLIDDAMDYLGLAKTSQDQADIAADNIPRSLQADLLHSNDYGHQAEAAFYQWALQGRGIV